jgi:hypothetical protein
VGYRDGRRSAPRLEEENRQLKRLVADQALNLQIVKDLPEKSGDARAAANDFIAPETEAWLAFV